MKPFSVTLHGASAIRVNRWDVPLTPSGPVKGLTMSLVGIILLILLVLLLLGALPVYPHSKKWGYGPSGIVGVLLVVLIILLIMRVF